MLVNNTVTMVGMEGTGYTPQYQSMEVGMVLYLLREAETWADFRRLWFQHCRRENSAEAKARWRAQHAKAKAAAGGKA